MADQWREHRGLSVPIRLIVAGTLLIVFALLVMAATGLLDSNYGQSLNEDLQPALDRGCIRWQNLRDDIATQKPYSQIMVKWRGEDTSVQELCNKYFRLKNPTQRTLETEKQGEKTVLYVKCWNYCMNDNVKVE